MFCGSSLLENSLRYLFNLSNDLPSSSSSPTSTMLKSYYLTKVHKLALQGNIDLQFYTKASKRCTKCLLSFTDYKPTYRIQPERKQNKFIKKLLQKRLYFLTCYQRNFLRVLKRRKNDQHHNRLIIKCTVCGKETRELLPKLQKLSIKETPRITPQKKKKRKKDMFIGLNKEAVLSLTPRNKPRSASKSTKVLKTPNGKAKDKAKTVPPISKSKQRRKNKRALKNLKNILSSDKKARGSNMLKQFLTSI